MNIVKIKDIVLTEESNLSEVQLTTYDTYYRGKYVLCVDWIHCYPLGVTDVNVLIRTFTGEQEAVNLNGQGIWIEGDAPQGYNRDLTIRLDTLRDLGVVDENETDKVNDDDRFTKFNKLIPNSVSSVDVKNFRTWLAEILITYATPGTENYRMLQYYVNGMHDDTVTTLSAYGVNNVVSEQKSSCGCGGNHNVSGLYNTTVDVCDPVSVYRKKIYDIMVDQFTEIDYWMTVDPVILDKIRMFIDGVITMQLPLTTSANKTLYADCGCTAQLNTVQNTYVSYLERLSIAFKYMADDELIGHKQYIATALADWAEHLYETMQWS